MSELSNDDRWRELIEIHEDMDLGEAVLPIRISAVDGSRIEASPKAARFAEALAFNARWSGITEARRKLDDLAA
jgi:hypothetical protein